jgi:hypothetical protein
LAKYSLVDGKIFFDKKHILWLGNWQNILRLAKHSSVVLRYQYVDNFDAISRLCIEAW